jgi:acetolactate synthase I/II/III large subunit
MLCSTDRLETYPMNGAQSLIRTLVGGGVDVCFANPGTSEMHFVASLDAVPEMRAVLALFEGVVTGAADGYGRMGERPAATLLHLGPGMANGLANLHNARRAHTPIVNVIGDHALYHKGFGAPLESEIESLTGWLHGWSRTSTDPMSVGLDAAEAIAAACTPPGQIANLVVPADVSWGTRARWPPQSSRQHRPLWRTHGSPRLPQCSLPASRRCCCSATERRGSEG